MGGIIIDMLNDYVIALDEGLLIFIERSIRKEIPDNYQYLLSSRISDRLADDIERIIGLCVRGYKNRITPGRIRHIYKRHGENGVADSSMADIRDIAKIGYIVENYNKIEKGNDTSGEFKNKDGSPSKTVVLQGNLDDEYFYVVEAVPDSARKTLYVTTAYINKNDTIAEAGDALSLNPDVQNGLQSDVSSNIIIPRDK